MDLTQAGEALIVIVQDDAEPDDSARRADMEIAVDRVVAAGGVFRLDGAPDGRRGSVVQLTLPLSADRART